MHQVLHQLLAPLGRLRECSRFHPEPHILDHSLQVFGWARRESDDPELWAAALLHDIGKQHTIAGHECVGAQLLRPFASERVTDLVAQHLELLTNPERTRWELAGTRELEDLEQIRRWDLAGRSPKAHTPRLDHAIDALMQYAEHWLSSSVTKEDA